MMMVANLVGFVIGVDGMQYMVEQLFGTINGKFFLSLPHTYLLTFYMPSKDYGFCLSPAYAYLLMYRSCLSTGTLAFG